MSLGMGMGPAISPLMLAAQATRPTLPTPEEETAAAEAAAQQMLEQASARAQSAQQQSAGALTALNAAEAAPVEQISPLTAGIGNTLTRLATTIGGTDYSTQHREDVASRNKLMREERTANIKRLRKTYEQAAKTAQEVGDHEAEIKSRVAIQKLDAAEKVRLQSAKKEADKEAADLEWQRKREMTGIEQKNALDRIEAESAAKAKAKKTEPPSTGDLLNGISKVTTMIRNDPELKDYIVVRDQVTMGRDAAAANNSAGDIILMRALARASDPRTGVREEEYRTFKDAQGALAARGIAITKGMVGKGTLSEFGRKSLLRRLEDLHRRKNTQATRSMERFKGVIDQFLPGVDRNLVLQAVEPEEESGMSVTEAVQNPPPSGGAALGTRRADGKVLVNINGQVGWTADPKYTKAAK